MRAFIFIFILMLSGCKFVSQATLPPRELPVEFQKLPNAEFSVAGKKGSVVIQDKATSGVCHKEELHGAYRRNSTITFWLAHIGASGETCPALAQLKNYRAKISGLEPGRYTIRVQYIGEVQTDTYPKPQEQVVTVE